MGFVVLTLEGRSLTAAVLPSGEVCLRADADPPGHAGSHPAEDAVLERIDLAHGRVALRVRDGRYLARHRAHAEVGAENGLDLVAELSQCAAFEEVPLPGGWVSLRTCDLTFLGVGPTGAVVADRVTNGSWERFRYLHVTAPVAGPVTGPVTGPVNAVPTQPGSAVQSATFATV